MTDEGLIRLMLSEPHNQSARLVWADWLEESGDLRAETVRQNPDWPVAGFRRGDAAAVAAAAVAVAVGDVVADASRYIFKNRNEVIEMENGFYLLLIRGSGYYYQIVVGEIEVKGFEILCKNAITITNTGRRIPSILAEEGPRTGHTEMKRSKTIEWLWRPDIVRAFVTDPKLWE